MSRSSSADDAAAAEPATGRNAQLVPPARFMDDLAETVRRYCLYRKVMTIEQLAARAGIDAKRMDKLLRRDVFERKQATGSELLSIWGVLRAAAASEALSAIGMVASDEAAGGEDARLGLAVADMFEAGADLAHIALDGAIKPGEVDAALLACDRVEEKVDELRRAARKARQK